MEDHVKRMLIEYDQLDVRTGKLMTFLDGPSSEVLTEQQRADMEEQRSYMIGYREVLAKRLNQVGIDLINRCEAEPTFGEKLVGKTFNPSGDDKVARLKALAAEMADIVEGHPSTNSYVGNLIKGNALREILNAQMNAVKHVTNKA
jgi:hypothetical protein